MPYGASLPCVRSGDIVIVITFTSVARNGKKVLDRESRACEDMPMTNPLRIILTALALTVLGSLLTTVGDAHAAPAPICAEDDPCFNCRTMGNRICGSDRWVRFFATNSGDRIIIQASPRYVATQIAKGQLGRGPLICLVSAKGRWGHIRSISACPYA